MDVVVEMNDIVKKYKELVALDHFNLKVEKGEIYGLLGPNGCGKTTAINCMLALTKYDKGFVNLFDQPMTPKSLDLKKRIGFVMQTIGVYNELTVVENIDYFCGLYINDKKIRKQYVDETISFVGLDKFRKFKPAKLSGGLLRRLNLACGIAHKPDLVILDEPTVAVDPQSRNKILDGIKKLAEEGKTIIYTTHYMEEVEVLCDRISIMDEGKVIVTGTSDEIKALSSQGEIVKIETFNLSNDIILKIRKIPNINTVEYKENQLLITFNKGQSQLVELMHLLNIENINIINLTVTRPTLNDVFLEITGKELRDRV